MWRILVLTVRRASTLVRSRPNLHVFKLILGNVVQGISKFAAKLVRRNDFRAIESRSQRNIGVLIDSMPMYRSSNKGGLKD